MHIRHRAAGRTFLSLVLIAIPAACNHTPVDNEPRLSTGKQIVEDEHAIPVDTFPANIAIAPNGKFAITSTTGYRQAMHSIRLSDFKDVCELEYSRTRLKSAGLYYGLAFGADGVLYAAQGAADRISVIEIREDGRLRNRNYIATKKGDFPSGLATDSKKHLYVANNDPSAFKVIFDHPGSVAIYDTESEEEIGRYEFKESHNGTPNYPLALAARSDGSKLYVASERDAAVYVLNTTDPAHPKLAGQIETGSHPDALLFNKAQSRLFVANASSDTVSIVDTGTDKVLSTILLRPEVAKDVAGATPTGLALSPDEKWLYVTLGDMNAVAVVDVKDAELEAYIPAGWYPTAVGIDPDGKHLLVVNGKGSQMRNPNPGYDSHTNKQEYVWNIIEGTVSRVPIPAKANFKALTDEALKKNRILTSPPSAQNPLASIGVASGKIKHVVYIVKENRTYDQVLGDMREGNGDDSLTIFGREVTPNQHALAERFVLMDNFYDCGEVSGDGWAWSTQATANEYVARNIPYSYSNRGRTFDYEGVVGDYPAGGFPAKGPDGKPLSDDPRYKNGAPAIPDVAEAPGGHIWDLVNKAGLSFRNYGFFLSHVIHKNNATTGPIIIPDNYPASVGLQPGGHDLEGKSDVDFRRFDMDYPDSEAPLHLYEQTKDPKFLFKKTGFGKYHAPSRFSEWKREFDLMLKKDPTGNSVPNFMTIRFCTDHTAGLSSLKHAPRGMVADDDYCIGQFIETLSHSPIWKSTAVFIIEDDAQNGPDHVDAHRSTCYVISPWIKRHSVDHNFHNTASCLRTMELLLGLPPMCQYDAFAKPIMDWDQMPSNDEPYTAILPNPELFRQINPQTKAATQPVSPEADLGRLSDQMDFEHADAAPADLLNQIIWKSIKGIHSELPKSPGGPFVDPKAKHDDDD